MICDIKNVQNKDILHIDYGIWHVKHMLERICYDHKFCILDKIIHQFTPQGCTVMFLLSESHISIHTFPEKNHISFDLYTCRENENNDEYDKIYEFLLEFLNASRDSNYKIVDRYF